MFFVPSVWLPVCLMQRSLGESLIIYCVAKIPVPTENNSDSTEVPKPASSDLPLPQTLVRIPTEQAPILEQAIKNGEVE